MAEQLLCTVSRTLVQGLRSPNRCALSCKCLALNQHLYSKKGSASPEDLVACTRWVGLATSVLPKQPWGSYVEPRVVSEFAVVPYPGACPRQ